MCGRPSDFIHYDLWLDLPERARFTRKYRQAFETPDHIILPSSLFDGSGLSYVNSSFAPFTLNGALLDSSGTPKRWKMKGFGKRKFHVGGGYSDHLPISVRFMKQPYSCESVGKEKDSSVPPSGNSGFERSSEGWVGCGKTIEVSRDTAAAAKGRFCLRLKGTTKDKNECAGRTILKRTGGAASKNIRVSLDIKGSGKICVRLRTGKDKWKYYKGESFEPAGAGKFLQVDIKKWRHVELVYTPETPPAEDVQFEIRAGKESDFCFYVDDVTVR